MAHADGCTGKEDKMTIVTGPLYAAQHARPANVLYTRPQPSFLPSGHSRRPGSAPSQGAE